MAGYELLSRCRDSFSIYFDGMLASFIFANLNGFFLSFFLFFFLSSQLSKRQTRPRALHLLPRQLDHGLLPRRVRSIQVHRPPPRYTKSHNSQISQSALIAVVMPLITKKARRHDFATSRGPRLRSISSCCAVPLRLRAHRYTTLTRSRSSIVAGIVHRASGIVHRAVRGLADHHRDITHHGHDPDVEDDDDDDAPAPAQFRDRVRKQPRPSC